jgi:DNA-binding transcriptional MerR regulator
MTNHKPDSLVTTSTAARILDRAESTIRKLTRQGALRVVAVTETGIRLYSRVDLESYRAGTTCPAKSK